MSNFAHMSGSVKTNIRRPVDFVGRDAEIEKILIALSQITRAWIISLTGVGGIGKTEIAVQVAHILKEENIFENIIWTTAKQFWLTPDGVEKHAPEYALTSLSDLLNTIISVLEMDPRYFSFSAEKKTHLVNEELKKSKTLIIIDNFETVEDRAILQFLINMPPGPSKALITSRLGGVDIHGSPIPLPQKLEGQREIRIGPLTEKDASTLLIKRAMDHGIDLSSEKHLKRIGEVVNHAARIPLALEWIVSQMAIKGYTLDDSLNSLRSSKGDVLSYCFDNLLRAVGKKSEKLLLAIPIFPDSVHPDILSVVTEMNKDARDEALRKLVAASLIELEPDGLYSVLAPTRLLVSTLWKDVPDLFQRYSLRATRYYINQLRIADVSQKWKTIEGELNNIIHLFNWCFENDYYDELLDLAHTLSSHLQRLGLWDQRGHVCEFATLAASYLGKAHDAIEFTYDAAEIHKHRGRLDQAIEEFRKCEDYSHQIGDKKKAAHARMQIGIVLFHMGKNHDADHILEQTLDMHKANNDKCGESINLSVLGRNEVQKGDFGKARNYFVESLRLKNELSDDLGQAIGLYDLGHLYHLSADLLTAEELLKKSIDSLEKLGDKRHLANAKRFYAYLKIEQGELTQAKNLLIDVLLSEEQFQRELRIETTSAKLAEIDQLAALVKVGQQAKTEDLLTGTRRVLVIGIENYLNMSSIPGAQKSARNIVDLLNRCIRPENREVTLLLNEQATKRSIKQYFEDMVLVQNSFDNPIFIFICHAIQYKNRNYLCGYDTDINDIENTAIEGTEFASMINELLVKSRFVIFDCHHQFEPDRNNNNSALGIKTGFAAKYLNFLSKVNSTYVISSAGDGELSHKFPDIDSLLFSHYFIKGIQGEACLRGDNLVHFIDLFYYLERKIIDKVKDQQPQIYPETVSSDVIVCSLPLHQGKGKDKKVEWIEGNTSEANIEDQRNRESIAKIREVIVKNPIAGSAQLSIYLSNIDSVLQNEVDLFRSELLRIETVFQKFTSLDPSLAVERQRCVYSLLEICHKLIQTVSDS